MTKDNLANSVQQRSRTDSTPNQRPGPDNRTSTGQEMLEGINITDRESCLSATDLELGR